MFGRSYQLRLVLGLLGVDISNACYWIRCQCYHCGVTGMGNSMIDHSRIILSYGTHKNYFIIEQRPKEIAVVQQPVVAQFQHCISYRDGHGMCLWNQWVCEKGSVTVTSLHSLSEQLSKVWLIPLIESTTRICGNTVFRTWQSVQFPPGIITFVILIFVWW